MIEYLLKTSIVVVLGLLFYKSVLQQESFFFLNRWFLICCLILSFLFPYILVPKIISQQGYFPLLLASDYNYLLQTKTITEKNNELSMYGKIDKQIYAQNDTQINVELKEKSIIEVFTNYVSNKSLSFFLIVFYFFGVCVFTCGLLIQVINILSKILYTKEKIKDKNCTILFIDVQQAPFSFFNYIFIHPSSYDYDTYERILAHEKIHVKQWHSIDLLLAEISVIFLWFNPFIWLFKKEIEKNLEYQTDDLLIQSGLNKEAYQMSLLRVACPHKPLTITNNYNQSLIKQRILKMNSKKSSPYSYVKYSFFVPFFLTTLLLLNEPAPGKVVELRAIKVDTQESSQQHKPSTIKPPIIIDKIDPFIEEVSQNNIISPQQTQKEERVLASFNTLTVSGLAVVYVSQKESNIAKLIVSGIPIEDVITKVEGSRLTVTTRGQHNGESIKIYIASPLLESITVSGAGQLYSENTLKAESLKLFIEGRGAATLDVDVKKLELNMNGGDLAIRGKAEHQIINNLESSSNGRLDNHNLIVQN